MADEQWLGDLDKEAIEDKMNLINVMYVKNGAYKYLTQSYKVYNAHEAHLLMYEMLKEISKRNDTTISDGIQKIIIKSRDTDFFVASRSEINSSWETEAFKQYAVTTTLYSIMLTVLDFVDDDLKLKDKHDGRGFFEDKRLEKWFS